MLIWRALGDMVLDYKWSAVEFLEFVVVHIDEETELESLSSLFDKAISFVGTFLPSLEVEQRYAKLLFEMLYKKCCESDTVVMMSLRMKLGGCIRHIDEVRRTIGWLSEGTGSANFTINQDMRW
eukprot:CAMPEP_0201282258 /NCGR_PEP_ID=MMETSP1317-20130820/5170_1 /ASSEMBLY_ACC=CAM_ASM_000770 /TAXON_ID=187299 /ORGANISM="Undescribed Undescribed, Strain Undescribed" /LENGTH=123 /DNA_ID=CAMNT_0047594403 /DNA_START=1934 /DNA_END=2305 /DNA_ORIENTATION=+